MMLHRRGFLSGVAAALALPAVVKADSLMKCPGVRLVLPRSARLIIPGWLACDGGEISPFEYPALAAALDKLQVPDMRNMYSSVEIRGGVVKRVPLVVHAVATGDNSDGFPAGTIMACPGAMRPLTTALSS